MADSFLPIQNVTADFKLDTEQLTVGANTVERERIQVTGAAAAEIARVVSGNPASGWYGLVVRPIGHSTPLGDSMIDDANDALRVTPVTAIQLTNMIPSSGLTLQEAIIDIATSGDNTIITGTAGQIISIYGIEYFCNVANNIILKMGITEKIPVQNFLANQGVIRDRDPEPWFAGASGEAFIMNLSAAQQVSGRVWYTKG